MSQTPKHIGKVAMIFARGICVAQEIGVITLTDEFKGQPEKIAEKISPILVEIERFDGDI